MTDAEKQALVERERARMAEPGYRESLVPPPAELTSDRETPEASIAALDSPQPGSDELTVLDWIRRRCEKVQGEGAYEWARSWVDAYREDVPLLVAAIDQLRAVRPLPDWMPTPEEQFNMARHAEFHSCACGQETARLLRAVRWLLEEREK